MIRALRTASSFHVTGRVTQNGRHAGLDIGLLHSGQLAGTISEQGTPLHVIVTGNAAFVKVSAGFLQLAHAPSAVCAVVCGKYVRLPVPRAKPLIMELSQSKLANLISTGLPPLTRAGTSVVDGQPVYVLRSAQGDVIDVAMAADHHPVAITSKSGTNQLHFSQWNSVPPPAAPPPGQVIDLGKLLG